MDVAPRLSSKDVVQLLSDRLAADEIASHFEYEAFTYSGQTLGLEDGGALRIRFPTLRKEHPDLYDTSTYNMLLVLGLRHEEQFSDALKTDLHRMIQRENLDKVVIWTLHEPTPVTVQTLKSLNIDMLFIQPEEYYKLRYISHFFPYPQHSYDYSVALNKIVDLLLKRLKKLFHLILSEIAAPIYDSLYATAKHATTSTMAFEEKVLHNVVQKLKGEKRQELAIDVGCGTGRHSFLLAPHFAEVYAFDFSPKMIDVAVRQKRKQDLLNVSFSVADMEHEEIADEQMFHGRADLVVASFGMGSFVEDTAGMLRRFAAWMKEDGYVFLSFYNKESILLQIEPNWRDTSLSAHISPQNNTLHVRLTPTTAFDIYCKAYSEITKHEISKVFEIEQVYTYPTTMALLPNTLFQSEIAVRLFGHLDDLIASHPDFPLGHYVVVVARKPSGEPTGAERVLEQLAQRGIEVEQIEHAPVVSSKDVIRELNCDPREMVKTIVFKDRWQEKYCVIAIRADKRVNKAAVAQRLGISDRRLEFASEKEIATLGFPIGGIAPWGYRSQDPVTFFLDQSVRESPAEWLFTGSGDNRKTLRIRTADLNRLMEEYDTLPEASSAGQ